MVRPYAAGHAAVEAGQWREYAGSSAFSDYGVTFNQSEAAVVENRTAHEPGIMEYDYTAASGSRQTYLHTNLIGTTEATSGSSPGSPPSAGRAVYSAFGERVYANGVGGGRYGYAGAWGYQAPGTNQCGPEGEEYLCDPLAELGWLHVGERYYDPACGRFVQRDPIGIRGGANVYAYANNYPVLFIDPDGRSFVSWVGGLGAAVASGAAVGAAGGAAVGAIAGAGIGAGPGAIAGAGTGAVGGGVAYIAISIRNHLGGNPQPGIVKSLCIGGLAGLPGGLGAGTASGVGAAVLGGIGGSISGGISSGGSPMGIISGGFFGGVGGMTSASGKNLLGGVVGADSELVGGSF